MPSGVRRTGRRPEQGDGAGLFLRGYLRGFYSVADEEEVVQGMLHYSESSGRSAVCSAPAPVSPRQQPTQQLHRHRLRRPAAGTSAPVRGVPYKRGGGGLVVAVASAEKNMGRQGWAEAASVVGA